MLLPSQVHVDGVMGRETAMGSGGMPGWSSRVRGLMRVALVCLSALAFAAGMLGSARVSAAAIARAASGLLYAQHPCTFVYAAPSTSAAPVTALLGGTDVTDAGPASTPGWHHVRIWSGLDAYAQDANLAATPPPSAEEGDCEFPGVPDPQDDIQPASRGPWPLNAYATVSQPATLYAGPGETVLPMGALNPGDGVSIQAWAADAQGRPWYQVRTDGTVGWLWSGDARLRAPDPATRATAGVPVWQKIAGKGMWFTNYLSHHSDVNALMRAAKLAGITHVYAEVAISNFGFYAQGALDRLLPAAHAQGIAVIAWVYPYLHDISADVRLTQWVANYATPSGLVPDGIATDVEEADDSASVYTYGQLVRALLGPDELMVAAVYHAFAQTYYPYAAIAASWNVLAPMDYWHSHANRAYSPRQVTSFVSNSIFTIRAALGALATNARLPIEELGQTYDMFTDDGVNGGNSPTGAEITADMLAARDAGCIGVSWFEWQTASQAEWSAIAAFAW